MSIVRVFVKRLTNDVRLPAYQTNQAAGVDLEARFDTGHDAILLPMERLLVGTGLAIELPVGYEAQVRPRSGWALKHGITVLNSPGTIDSDYRGEIKVLLINLGASPVQIKSGERIAQLVFAPVSRVDLLEVEDLGQTVRGVGGYGHTGS